MSLRDFKAELSGRPEFRHVTAKKSREIGNAVRVGGDAVGKGSLDELSRIGRRHGFLVMADRLTVWYTWEDFERYGPSKPEEDGGTPAAPGS